MRSLQRYVPILQWGKDYSRSAFSSDLLAALIVTIMLIPQSLAYALIAGLPPEAGLYASIVPIVLYALLGTSRALAVGPVAVVSLMTAAAIGKVAEQGTADYASAALMLAFLSGAILVGLGLLRFGFIANFLSHPVISGFITASALLIALGQLGPLMGSSSKGHGLVEMLEDVVISIAGVHWQTAALGLSTVAFLYWTRWSLGPLLTEAGLAKPLVNILAKSAPVVAIAATTLAVWTFDLAPKGVAIVGEVPQSLPPFTTPILSLDLAKALILPALLISIIGFVESISVAQTLAAKKRQNIDPNQELIGLGAANLGAAFSGGFPVTGGFSRSVVNFDAGAETPAAGIYTAVGLAIAALFLTPLIYFLPKATLAATIIVAVLSLVDASILKKTWQYSRADFLAVAATITATLLLGVEVGVAVGMIVSLSLHIYHTSKPHIAEVGCVPGTEHFRNVLRHKVETSPTLLTLRIDQSMYFANTKFLEDHLMERVARSPEITDVVLMCSAVNEIDFSALESLSVINSRLVDANIRFHLSEVKGPVMDRLSTTGFLRELSGEVFLSQHQAWRWFHNS